MPKFYQVGILTFALFFFFFFDFSAVSALESNAFIYQKITGTISYDKNGNGLADDGHLSISSVNNGCANTMVVEGIQVLISYPGFSKMYPVDKCEIQDSGIYTEGVTIFETDPVPNNIEFTASLVLPAGWKVTSRDPVRQKESLVGFNITQSPWPTSQITVLAPNGGERWRKNKTQTIKWEAPGVKSVYINLSKGNDEMGKDVKGKIFFGKMIDFAKKAPTALAVNVPNTGSYEWRPPAWLTDGDDYRITIEDSDNLPSDDQSDSPFTIMSFETNEIIKQVKDGTLIQCTICQKSDQVFLVKKQKNQFFLRPILSVIYKKLMGKNWQKKVKKISDPAVLDAAYIVKWVKLSGGSKVYELDEDGAKHLMNMNKDQLKEMTGGNVFTISSAELKLYKLDSDILP